MKPTRKLLLGAMLALAATAAGKGKMMPRVYMYGFSASFTDSTVYFTNVQAVDSVWIDTKTNFLLGRENYSIQLKDMLASKMGAPNRTCIVMFSTKRNKVEKDFVKMRRKYTEKAKNHYDVRYIADTDFRFKPIDMSYEEAKPEEKAEQPKAPQGEKPGMNGGRPPQGPPPTM